LPGLEKYILFPIAISSVVLYTAYVNSYVQTITEAFIQNPTVFNYIDFKLQSSYEFYFDFYG